MAKTSYTCVECGYKTPKPLGRCPACGAWESFQEVAPSPLSPSHSPPYTHLTLPPPL
ncbi:DNA repair protein RadA, partial [Thermus scotoductus]